MDRETRYLSYLLRLWQQGGGERVQWRASLESPHGGKRRAFASLADLFAFLREQTGSRSPESGQHEAEETGLAADE
jgi:hypothetical protein